MPALTTIDASRERAQLRWLATAAIAARPARDSADASRHAMMMRAALYDAPREASRRRYFSPSRCDVTALRRHRRSSMPIACPRCFGRDMPQRLDSENAIEASWLRIISREASSRRAPSMPHAAIFLRAPRTYRSASYRPHGGL